MAERPTERQRVEEYLKVHCIQECLDEVINDLIESRPSNPYIAITKMMETKTLGEITDIQINSTITGRGSSGIKATVHTNIGSFSAIAAYPYSSDAPYGLTRDFTVIEDILKDALCSLDPRNMSDIDGKLDMISTLGSTISIAVSMACCRAGARHKGLPLYRYLNSVGQRDKNCDSKLGGLESQLGLAALRIPLPVVAMISRSKIEEGKFTLRSRSVSLVTISLSAPHVCINLQLSLSILTVRTWVIR